MNEALLKIQKESFYKCPICSSIATSSNDLVKDWRVQAYKEFHESVQEVQLINKLMFNKYYRNRRYQDFFLKNEYSTQIEILFENVHLNAQLNSLIKKDLQQQNSYHSNKITIWFFCLLDNVKINITVRILGCKHYQCYELTSLLQYQELYRKEQVYFHCNYLGCSNRLKIANLDYYRFQQNKKVEQEKFNDIQLLFSGITVDLDILYAIKKSHPSSLKFDYDIQTQTINEDFNRQNGKYFDPFIQKFYQDHQDIQQKENFEQFQGLILQFTIPVIYQDPHQVDPQLRYRNFKVKMIDQLTQLPIEYPVRCKLCTNLEVCMDMRSFIADFIYQKQINPSKNYICPICKRQGGRVLMMNIFQKIYLDQNMLQQRLRDMSPINNEKLLYEKYY